MTALHPIPHPPIPHPIPLTRRRWMGGALSAAGLWGLDTRSALALPLPALPPPLGKGRWRWRIGYAEAMPYGNYAATLAAILKALEGMGWVGDLSEMPFTPGQTDSAALWSWLSREDASPVLDFVPDAHVTNLNPASAAPLIGRLRDRRDLDLLIVMGTVAGIALANDTHRVPTLVFSSTNPVAAGIVASETDSGSDHVWAHLDPRRFQRQIAIFHKTFRFRRLGVAYEDSPAGRAIASLADIEAAAARIGFDLVRRPVRAPANDADQPRYEEDLGTAWRALSREAEAMYITYGRWSPSRLPELIRPFIDRRVPTFSQLGPEEVEKGALMSIARADMAGVGHVGATTMARILGGESPRRLPQVYFDTPSIAWNAATAAAIGYRIPFPALLAADALYGVP